MPIHLKVSKGDVSERVIVVGDPARARQLAGMLKDSRIINENRGFLAYTGSYNGVEITIATHGIGAPSAAIVIEELVSMGARVIVRLGTAAALRNDIEPGTVLIPSGAGYNAGGIYAQYLGSGVIYPAVPNHEVLLKLISSFTNSGLNFIIGAIYSSDAFYAEEDLPRMLGSRGVIGVEMECAILFLLGLIRGIKTGAALVVTNKLTEGRFGRFLEGRELELIINKVGAVVLNALSEVT
ncbi:purine-nucleoside phosphorylase [Caldivirga maquilingensis]|uniref:Purine or other phosphorylase family 1 n=1 Tax=Caldivirga maquilingensis (strain ATCC 700844 / DSM 13496 / JCM 10307 / IC-167) TaxID=397948 RepID=A8M9F0_CALMQ|nr:purine-nucleoside phosphorylase [Caldivirga maquilingensis]ABW02369.1 purine or other phosphorylase family 1 [Caldivirga maquilingensis IC-167]